MDPQGLWAECKVKAHKGSFLSTTIAYHKNAWRAYNVENVRFQLCKRILDFSLELKKFSVRNNNINTTWIEIKKRLVLVMLICRPLCNNIANRLTSVKIIFEHYIWESMRLGNKNKRNWCIRNVTKKQSTHFK